MLFMFLTHVYINKILGAKQWSLLNHNFYASKIPFVKVQKWYFFFFLLDE